jgi:CspA family cold shock protein
LLFLPIQIPISEEVTVQMKGKIKWYNERKGFGFIEVEDSKDVFVHRTALPEGLYLNDGDNVEFETEDSDRGPSAINVKKLPNA